MRRSSWILAILTCLSAPVAPAQTQDPASNDPASAAPTAPAAHPRSPIGRAMADFTSLLREASQQQTLAAAHASDGTGAVTVSGVQATTTVDVRAHPRGDEPIASSPVP